MPACYWSNSFSVITISKYENNRKQSQEQDILGNLEIPARTCSVKRGHVVSLVICQSENGKSKHCGMPRYTSEIPPGIFVHRA